MKPALFPDKMATQVGTRWSRGSQGPATTVGATVTMVKTPAVQSAYQVPGSVLNAFDQHLVLTLTILKRGNRDTETRANQPRATQLMNGLSSDSESGQTHLLLFTCLSPECNELSICTIS